MTRSELRRTRELCARFITEIKLLEDELAKADYDYVITGTKRSGQVRRMSLDLTRQLAVLRKR